jgi:prephenate dehydrogenase
VVCFTKPSCEVIDKSRGEDMDDCDFSLTIAIVGLGLIGGSYAKAIRGLKPKKIIGIDKDLKTLETAIDSEIIDEGFIEGEILKEADLIILALYPKATIEFARKNAANFKIGAVITDVCGVKQVIIQEIVELLPEYVEFVGGHPMAGKESKGFEQSCKELFIDSNYIITPHEKNSLKNLALIEQMAYGIGCKKVIRIDSKEHDSIISYTSQLPHVIAVALMNSDLSKDFINCFAGGSFKDATRVADINAKLWIELLTINSSDIMLEIAKFQKKLDTLQKAICTNNVSQLEEYFSDAVQKRRMLI